jgi:hypothetical protein
MQLRPLSPDWDIHRNWSPGETGLSRNSCLSENQTGIHFAASITGHASVTGKSKACNLKAVAGNLLLEISCHRESCKT